MTVWRVGVGGGGGGGGVEANHDLAIMKLVQHAQNTKHLD